MMNCFQLLSTFAFNVNLRPYTLVRLARAEAAAAAANAAGDASECLRHLLEAVGLAHVHRSTVVGLGAG
jgi:hypothetical protein